MDELISRQAAIDALDKRFDNIPMEQTTEILQLRRDLRQLPSAQSKRGKWIKVGRWGRVYKCNQCGNFLDFDGVNAGRGSTNFCPNCGSYNGGEHDG